MDNSLLDSNPRVSTGQVRAERRETTPEQGDGGPAGVGAPRE